jgi:hypothetical protein
VKKITLSLASVLKVTNTYYGFTLAEDGNDKLENGILSFRGWLWDQHFGPDHHISIDLAEQFSY